MNKASKSVTLVLVGSAALLLMYLTCNRDRDATTQPAGSGHAGGYHGWFHGWGGSGSGARSLSSGSGSHGSVSRGGFGGTGHAVGA